MYNKEDIIDYYRRYNEDDRLKTAFGRLEEEHTRRLILRHILNNADVIFDIGGGTGAYALWLAGLGYVVNYSDIVPDHVQLFEQRVGTGAINIAYSIQDARELSFDDDRADVIILNGPLYHLCDRNERSQVLREACRVLKHGGRLLAFTISRFAGAQYAISSGRIFEQGYFDMVVHEIATGIRKNQSTLLTFDSAYFHTQDEIEAEMREAGFQSISSYGVLGLSGNLPDLEAVVDDDDKRQRLLALAEIMEPYPMLGSKIMTVGVKTTLG